MKIDNWNIHLINDSIPFNSQFENILNYFKLTFHSTYLLNTQQNKFCILEKFIYDIVCFHCNRFNIDINQHYVEFWFNRFNLINNVHIDGTNYDNNNINTPNNKDKPLFSCLTYMNNSNIPTVLTNVTANDFNNNNISNKHTLCISFPKKLKHICFDGGRYYHGNYDIFNCDEIIDSERYVLVINLWKTIPEFVPYFDNSIFNLLLSYMLCCNNGSLNENVLIDKQDNIIAMEEAKNNIKILYSNNAFNYNFYKTFIRYRKNKNAFEQTPEILKIIKGCINEYDIFMFDKLEINTDSIKFKQRFIIKEIYNNIICDWIINECEKYAALNNGWTNNRHEYFPTTDLPINIIPDINSYFKSTLNTIYNYISAIYCLEHEKILYDINDAFIVKYNYDGQNYLEEHVDKSTISINILLNSENDFIGGGTQFNDSINILTSKGDMLIHSSKELHSGSRIFSGVRYVLVAFINIHYL